MSITETMVFGFLVTWLALFLFAVVWSLSGMPYPVSIDVFVFFGGLVAISVLIIKAEKGRRSNTNPSR